MRQKIKSALLNVAGFFLLPLICAPAAVAGLMVLGLGASEEIASIAALVVLVATMVILPIK